MALEELFLFFLAVKEGLGSGGNFLLFGKVFFQKAYKVSQGLLLFKARPRKKFLYGKRRAQSYYRLGMLGDYDLFGRKVQALDKNLYKGFVECKRAALKGHRRQNVKALA